jgi:hypothetical protein
MAGAADVRFAALFERLIRANFVALVVDLAAGRAHQLAEFVIKPFVAEVALFFRHPFVQAEMRFDDKFCHYFLSLCFSRR